MHLGHRCRLLTSKVGLRSTFALVHGPTKKVSGSPSYSSRQEHSLGSSIQKSVHFLPFMKRFGNFLFTRKLPKAGYFTQLNSEIYFSHSEIFPYSSFVVQCISEVVYSKSDFFVLILIPKEIGVVLLKR